MVHASTLTAVCLIGVVLAVKVAITVPQLEGTVPIATGKLVGLTALGGVWRSRQASVGAQALPCPLPALCLALTTI